MTQMHAWTLRGRERKRSPPMTPRGPQRGDDAAIQMGRGRSARPLARAPHALRFQHGRRRSMWIGGQRGWCIDPGSVHIEPGGPWIGLGACVYPPRLHPLDPRPFPHPLFESEIWREASSRGREQSRRQAPNYCGAGFEGIGPIGVADERPSEDLSQSIRTEEKEQCVFEPAPNPALSDQRAAAHSIRSLPSPA